MSELISIIIPVYNRAKQVKNAISSVEQQTYTNWEIILVDDGSSSLAYQSSIQSPKIQIINNHSNKGVSCARNIGIQYAKGSVIAFLDSDNTWEDTFLEKMYLCMKSLNVNAVFCGWNYFFADKMIPCLDSRSESLLENNLIPTTDKSNRYSMDSMSFLRLAVYEKTNFTHINAMLVRREAVSFFDETLRISEDTFWIYQLLSKIRTIGYLNDPFLRFISSEDSVYLFMDRTEIIDLSQLPRVQQQQLVKTLSESVRAYSKLIAYFATEVKDLPLTAMFRKTRNNKRYTILILKQMLEVPLSWADLKGQSIGAYIRYSLGKPPLELSKLCHHRIDYF